MVVTHGAPSTVSSRPGCALTIGNFDGVHRGHQALLERALRRAKALSVPSCVLTFEPHPREFFAARAGQPAPARLTRLRDKLEANTKFFREEMTRRGFNIVPGTHPIVPIMLGDAALSQKFAARMLEKGVYVIGFFYPVVPHGTARVRTQVSAAHSREDLEFAVNAFAETNAELK